MLSVNKILFPVDFSERCQSAAPYVADLANRFRARLDLLHVVEGSPVEELRRQSAAALAAFAGHIPHGMYCPQTVAHGDPADAIVRYAKTHGIDIIAMPAGRRSSFSWPSASVTGKVLRHAPCAVWTGSSMGRPQANRSPVLCAVDLEAGSEHVLSYASTLARDFRSKLIVVHAVLARAIAAHAAAATGGSPRGHSHLSFASSGNDPQHKLDELLQGINISAEAMIETGTPGEAIRRAAERTGAALLVVGRGSRAGQALSTDAHEFMRRTPCPVVFFPSQPAAPVCFWTEWQQEEDHAHTADSPLNFVSKLSR